MHLQLVHFGLSCDIFRCSCSSLNSRDKDCISQVFTRHGNQMGIRGTDDTHTTKSGVNDASGKSFSIYFMFS